MPHALRVLWALLRQPTPRAAQPMQFRLQLWALTALVLLLASLGGGAPSDGDGGTLSNGGGGEGVTATAAPWMAPAAQRVASVPPGHAAREHLGSLDGWSLARSGRVYTPLSLSPLLVYTRVVGQQLSVRVNGVAAAGAAELTGRLQPLRLCPLLHCNLAPSLRNLPLHPRRSRAAPTRRRLAARGRPAPALEPLLRRRGAAARAQRHRPRRGHGRAPALAAAAAVARRPRTARARPG